jgi:hypothetical protein
VLLIGSLQGAAQLAQDLVLARNDGLQSRGHLEQVVRDAAIEVDSEVGLELVARHASRHSQGGHNFVDGSVE